MRTPEEIEKILDATYRADPDVSDPDMDLIRDTLNWVTGDDTQSAEEWLDYQGITDMITEADEKRGKLDQ